MVAVYSYLENQTYTGYLVFTFTAAGIFKLQQFKVLTHIKALEKKDKGKNKLHCKKATRFIQPL